MASSAGKGKGKGSNKNKKGKTKAEKKSDAWVLEGDLSQHITAVRNQGDKVQCWADSVCQAMEVHLSVLGYGHQTLSAEYLVDNCNPKAQKKGKAGYLCDFWKVIKFIHKNGIYLAANYSPDPRHKNPSKKGLVEFLGLELKPVNPGDTHTMKHLFHSRVPVLAVIDATDEFINYTGGIYEGPKKAYNKSTPHGVLLIGSGEDDDIPFLRGINSWGVTWGEQGYFRIALRDHNPLISTTVYISTTGVTGIAKPNPIEHLPNPEQPQDEPEDPEEQ